MITKATFRKTVLQYRRLIEDPIYWQRNDDLCSNLISFIDKRNVTSVHSFLSIQKNKEPDTSPIFERLWAKDVKLIISKTDFVSKQMHHYNFEEQTVLSDNKMGIPEPVDAKEASIADLDLILVPLLVGDMAGFRIGYGGGYYDRLLKETKAIKVGLSLSPPVDKIIQQEEWDVPLDYLITPFKIYNYG